MQSGHGSNDISEGVRSSARAVQAAEDGLRRMGTMASSQALGTAIPVPGKEVAKMCVELISDRPSLPSDFVSSGMYFLLARA